MKIIKRAIRLSYARFCPNDYQRRYHFAIAFNCNKPIIIAQNNPTKISHKAYQIGKQFNIKHYQRYPYAHAESHLVSKLLNTYNAIDTNLSIVVLRFNKQGKILLSKPCKNCQKILDALGLKKVYWSIDEQTFGCENNLIYLK